MIDNPQSSLEKPHEKASTHWWQRVKAILFGQWVLSKENDLNSLKDNIKLIDNDKPCSLKSSFKDWLQAVDVIQPLVHSIRKDIEPQHNDEFDLDLLAANTYLFHVDRLLVKIREYLHQFRYRYEQSHDNTLYSFKVEMNQAANVADQCYLTIVQLTAILQRLGNKKIYSQELISQIHALELDTTALGSAIRTLNQSAYKAESMVQLAALEQELLQSLTQNKPIYSSGTGYVDNNMHFNLSHTQGEYLRSKANLISDPALNKLINGLIDIHELLKKCYVVARKVFIKEALELMATHIEGLIAAIGSKEQDKKQIFYHFNEIFHSVETIRFNTNRESRCSRNLFEKSRQATMSLRKVCQKHPIGLEYLKAFSVKRATLVKPKE